MFKVGLTGGIGSGKSTVSALFQTLDVPVIDADEIAHALVKPGEPALQEICAQFGERLLNPDGSLNRDLLRTIVFNNPVEKQKLETILHPRVEAEIKVTSDSLTNPYCIISVPLLFEANLCHLVNRVLVVDCPVDLQRERVRQRSHLTEDSIRAIIASQTSRDYRLRHADDIIDNTVSHGELADRVKKLHNLYLSISTAKGTAKT
ncbi:MAG: dephospho-CoA kinase [Gammaproteobacteria bacterium]|nr:dephospho-CoA kinase [Gammaproteobacteria bacterium]